MRPTPGPWWANVRMDSARIEADGATIGWVSADCITENLTEVLSAQAKANARLMAAAPDLLQACVSAVSVLMVDVAATPALLKALNAAIRKAGGK